MMVRLLKSKIEEAEILKEIQREVFQEDLIKYQDYESNPANESLEE
jgi:hypothetical protein